MPSSSQQKFVVNLSDKDGSSYKKTLLCREGIFDGMYGPCTVTPELLEKMANHYNTQRAIPQNENDYAPILLDHARAVDNIKGRLMANLAVAPWVNPEDGKTYAGLYGDLRVDVPDAIEKVDQGIYSQVSLSFDEETGEIFEVSFVAVEAARRSQVLSKGEGNMNFEEQFKALSAKHSTTLQKKKEAFTVRKAQHESLSLGIVAAESEIALAMEKAAKAITTIKNANLSSKFKGLVKEGRLSHADFKALKIADLAALPKEALTAVLSAYESRPINPDFLVHGQTGAKPVNFSLTGTPAQVREAIKLQKSGKKPAALAAEADADDKDKDQKDKDAADLADKAPDYSDADECMSYLNEMYPMITKVSESMKKMSDQLKKLAESDSDSDETDPDAADKDKK